VSTLYAELEPALRQANAVTFDDLLTLPVEILRASPQVLEQYRRRFRFVLVDEYQDTNHAQFELVRLLGGEHGNVMVVGDDDQSIYGWRGADVRNISTSRRPGPTPPSSSSRRTTAPRPTSSTSPTWSSPPTPAAAGKTLRATRPGGERVALVGALDDRDEADFVLEEVAARRAGEGRALRDFAVLYRTNSQSRTLEEALRRRGYPYRLVGSVRFYDRREIRDLMAYLKLVANPNDGEAFRRVVNVPKRGIGDTSVDMIAGMAESARVPLLDMARRPETLAALRPAARAPLAEFVALVDRLRAAAPSRASPSSSTRSRARSSTATTSRPRAPTGRTGSTTCAPCATAPSSRCSRRRARSASRRSTTSSSARRSSPASTRSTPTPTRSPS
jgi:DNA helicase-2/ATP-dependent DNA helicase PcrA